MDNFGPSYDILTTHGNASSDFEGLPPQSWVAFIGLWIAALVTVVGNLMVVASFIIYRDIRNKVSHFFLLNLAISDFVVGLLSLPLDNLWRWHDRWPYGRTACVIWTFIDYTVTTQSAYSIVLISLDRYFLIRKGLSYTSYQTKSRALCQIGTSWFISIGFHLVGTIWYETMHENMINFDEECELNALRYLPYTITAMFVEFLIPLGCVIVLYINIYLNIRKRTSGFVTKIKPTKALPAEESKDSGVSEVGTSSIAEKTKLNKNEDEVLAEKDTDMPGNEAGINNASNELELEDVHVNLTNESKHRSNPNKSSPASRPKSEAPKTTDRREKSSEPSKKHRQAAKMLSVLVGVFIICWLPYNITLIIDVIWSDDDLISWQAWDIVNYLLWFNSAVNPFLYACTNIHFRRGFYNILKWCISPCYTLKRRY